MTNFKNLVESFEKERKFEDFKKIKIALLGTYTLNNLQYPLKLEFYKSGFNPEIKYGGYNQFIQELSDPASWLKSYEPDIIFIALSTKGFFTDIEYKILDIDKIKLDELINDKFSFIENSINSNLKSKIIISNLDYPSYSPYGLMDFSSENGLFYLVSEFNKKLIDLAKRKSNLIILDFENLLSKLGKKEVFDEKMYFLGKILLNDYGAEHLTKEIVKISNAIYGNIKKCLVVDLDNTLWGGVVGEDGPNGIIIGDTTLGNIYSEIQKVILNYKKLGVIICINSKNNLSDVEEVFKKNPNMILKESDFVIKKINWNQKSNNIKEIAKELKIGLDSMVFLDDNPVERMEVKSSLPMVNIVDFPEDISKLPSILKELPFYSLKLTEEDKKRNEMYRQDVERNQLKIESNLNDYLYKLKTKIIIKKNDVISLDRITQLINKTNQFNLRTKRYTDKQVESMMKSEDFTILSLTVSDKFGNLGLTGAIIFQKIGNSTFIDNFLLSCRILSRKIEKQFFIESLKYIKTDIIESEYIPTQKNEQVKDFYEELGFEVDDIKDKVKHYKKYLNGFKLKNIDWIEVENERN